MKIITNVSKIISDYKIEFNLILYSTNYALIIFIKEKDLPLNKLALFD